MRESIWLYCRSYLQRAVDSALVVDRQEIVALPRRRLVKVSGFQDALVADLCIRVNDLRTQTFRHDNRRSRELDSDRLRRLNDGPLRTLEDRVQRNRNALRPRARLDGRTLRDDLLAAYNLGRLNAARYDLMEAAAELRRAYRIFVVRASSGIPASSITLRIWFTTRSRTGSSNVGRFTASPRMIFTS